MHKEPHLGEMWTQNAALLLRKEKGYKTGKNNTNYSGSTKYTLKDTHNYEGDHDMGLRETLT